MKNYSIVTYCDITKYCLPFYATAILEVNLPRLISYPCRCRKIEIRQLTPYRRFTDAEHETDGPHESAGDRRGAALLSHVRRGTRGE